jgi:hypothetical protein
VPRDKLPQKEAAGAPVGSYSAKYEFIDRNVPTRVYGGHDRWETPHYAEAVEKRKLKKPKTYCKRVERTLVKYRPH